MTLSIITVNLNNRDGLQRTIDSVVSQTFTDYEWIVIDGGSTDGSRMLIEQYSDNFAYWCSEPDKGIYNAMNKGIANATGDWFLFLNSGDWLFNKDVLGKIFNIQWNCDVIYGNMLLVKNGVNEPHTYPDNIVFSYFYDHTICHQATFYKGEVLKNKRYNEDFKIAADWLMQMELILLNKKFSHINEFITCFDGNGIGSQSNYNVFHERYLIYENYIPYHIKKDIEYVKKWEFVENRRSLRFLHNLFFKMCIFANKILHLFEKKSK